MGKNGERIISDRANLKTLAQGSPEHGSLARQISDQRAELWRRNHTIYQFCQQKLSRSNDPTIRSDLGELQIALAEYAAGSLDLSRESHFRIEQLGARLQVLGQRLARKAFQVDRSMPEKDQGEVHNELAVAHAIIKKLRNKVQGRPSEDDLKSLADQCRKKNGTINFSKLGKKLGVSNHTAGKWCGNKIT